MRCALALWQHRPRRGLARRRPSRGAGAEANGAAAAEAAAAADVERALAAACPLARPARRGQPPPPGLWGYTPVGTGGPDDDADARPGRNGVGGGIGSGIGINNRSAGLGSSSDRLRDPCFARRRKPPCYPGLRTASSALQL
jgi:hypothetical protein